MTRVQASLVEWKDDKGYGFARLPGGTDRVFVHIRSLQHNVPRPKKGDMLELELIDGKKGPAAQNVRVLNEAEIAHSLPYHVVTATMLFILAQLVVILGKAPFGLVVYYALAGALSIYLYGRDKQAAIAGRWRVSESHLLTVDLMGGIIGGLLAQQRYWHKTSKQRFQMRVFVIVVLHAGLLAALGSGLLNWPF
ncbi:MAG: cold shock and DUF1294 domain-containing protein [Alphaproteobacteria bacterium]|nr:cold shock and DUF1294 domain-containing protein [Alphaproteobacteria bacterium]